MLDIQDIHTHNQEALNAIINYDPTVDNYAMSTDKLYSVGIHPWNTDKATQDALSALSSLASENNVMAIGEAGIDKLYDGDIYAQISLFEYHISLSESLKKPLIIHCVKAIDEILRLHKKFSPSQIWIYHGFRGKPQLAEQLIAHGFYLSFGKNYNNDSLLLALKHNRAFRETD